MNSYGIISGIKDYELNGIESFVNELLKIKNSITIVNNYYLGYSIPQIGKEFDLLRFGDNYIINIEIKTESSIDKIFKQQQKNKYYLEFLDKEIYIYTYILNEMMTSTTNDAYVDYTTPTALNIASTLTHKYALKTGSTNTDYWIVGYNPDRLMMMWMGYDNNKEVNGNVRNNAKKK